MNRHIKHRHTREYYVDQERKMRRQSFLRIAKNEKCNEENVPSNPKEPSPLEDIDKELLHEGNKQCIENVSSNPKEPSPLEDKELLHEGNEQCNFSGNTSSSNPNGAKSFGR